MKEKPFEYMGLHGTRFKADRCDFRNGVTVEVRPGISQGKLAQAVAGMAGYHATVILPKLNGFAGYDAVTFTVSEG
ncbi:MAG: hypothetical protein HYS43_00695 [Candidatus Liptonbacteria bacterium]|nr:hypothetical protein [Candidatus Liptonbacteria bacterium]